jgi:hypothetical protein
VRLPGWYVQGKNPFLYEFAVDDKEFLRDLGSRILGNAGYKDLTASTGKEALGSDEIDLNEADYLAQVRDGGET